MSSDYMETPQISGVSFYCVQAGPISEFRVDQPEYERQLAIARVEPDEATFSLLLLK